jgi:hypothetical protein
MNIFDNVKHILALCENINRRTLYMVDQLSNLKHAEVVTEASAARAEGNVESLLALVARIQVQLQNAISSGGPIADIQVVADKLAAVTTNLDAESVKVEAAVAADAAASQTTATAVAAHDAQVASDEKAFADAKAAANALAAASPTGVTGPVGVTGTTTVFGDTGVTGASGLGPFTGL